MLSAGNELGVAGRFNSKNPYAAVNFLEAYGAAAQRGMKARVFGGLVSPDAVFKKLPASRLIAAPGSTVLAGVISSILPTPKAHAIIGRLFGSSYLNEYKGSRAHYTGYAANPAHTQAVELMSELQDRGLTDKMYKQHGLARMLRPGTISERLQPLERMYGGKSTASDIARKSIRGTTDWLTSTSAGAKPYGAAARVAGKLGTGVGILGMLYGLNRMRNTNTSPLSKYLP
jgi:hypothetical protein